MAIKMTKRGTPPQEQVYVGCCLNCRSEFECVGADLQHVSDPRELFTYTYTYIVCTVCKAHVRMALKLSSLSAGRD